MQPLAGCWTAACRREQTASVLCMCVVRACLEGKMRASPPAAGYWAHRPYWEVRHTLVCQLQQNLPCFVMLAVLAMLCRGLLGATVASTPLCCGLAGVCDVCQGSRVQSTSSFTSSGLVGLGCAAWRCSQPCCPQTPLMRVKLPGGRRVPKPPCGPHSSPCIRTALDTYVGRYASGRVGVAHQHRRSTDSWHFV